MQNFASITSAIGGGRPVLFDSSVSVYFEQDNAQLVENVSLDLRNR